VNEPAFPRQHTVADANDPAFKMGHPGMDLRDYFAAKAMQGLIQWAKYQNNEEGGQYVICLATDSYEIADAMLKERAKKDQSHMKGME
jgi:hypothetical protein